jgi:hypothetical protein
MFDEEPDGDPHGECAEEIKRLGALVTKYRKLLWVLARNDGLSLAVPKKDIETIPGGAELLVWDEPLFDATMIKGICHPINQPELAKRLDVP